MSRSPDLGRLPAIALPASHDSSATIYAALAANAVIALAKGIAAWFTGSTSLEGEGDFAWLNNGANQVNL